VGLEHLDTGVKVIVENIRVEVEEISKETEEIILNMRRDLDQGRIAVAEMLKALNTTKSSPSTITTTSLAKPHTSQTTTEPSSSSPFLEKEKEMLELKAKLLSKRTKPNPAVKTVSFDICDPFIAEYRRVTELAYRKLKSLSNIFYSGGRSIC